MNRLQDRILNANIKLDIDGAQQIANALLTTIFVVVDAINLIYFGSLNFFFLAPIRKVVKFPQKTFICTEVTFSLFLRLYQHFLPADYLNGSNQ